VRSEAFLYIGKVYAEVSEEASALNRSSSSTQPFMYANTNTTIAQLFLRWQRNHVAQVEVSLSSGAVPLFNALFNHLCEYCHIIWAYCRKKLDTLAYIFVADFHLGEVIGSKATESVKITQNNGHYSIQGHSMSSISVPMESPYAAS